MDPPGLPHLGTFGEVARTTMVKRAFEALCPDIPTKLVAFSDDMDGFRKVPTNVPNQELLASALAPAADAGAGSVWRRKLLCRAEQPPLAELSRWVWL